MLKIIVPGRQERWDESKEEFVYSDTKDVTLRLEHSLISISKWESKYHVPFLSSDKSDEQILYYIKCMALNVDPEDEVFNRLTMQNIKQINEYIADPMTATIVNDEVNQRPSREFVTSELIYYWMFSYSLPIELEKWHINRLIMLIRVFSAKNAPPKKRSRAEIIAEQRALNAARRKKYNTKG